MKKMNNKGFSLVELIIVIAIMAILAGAIAPALIRYIDKSRRSNDVSACKTIKTAVETAMGNEKAYEYLTSGAVISDEATSIIEIVPGKKASSPADAVKLTVGTGATIDNEAAVAADITMVQTEIAKNVGETMPSIKYKKAADSTIGVPKSFYITCTSEGTIKVWLAKAGLTTGITDTSAYAICPEICDDYQ